MSNWFPNHRNDDRKDEIPPYSRIFIVCSKDLGEQDLRDAFAAYGDIENLYIPKDRNTGNPRGVAYIKYSKTSSAAAAIEALNQKTIGNCNRPMKVMVASKRDDMNDNSSDLTYDRLFIKTSKQSTEEEIQEHFSKFGRVESVLLLKDKTTNEYKGLGFVRFRSFFDAATAIEECDKKYKAVFAEPKQELKRGRDDRRSNDNLGSYNGLLTHNKDNYTDYYNNDLLHRNNASPFIKTQGLNYKAVVVTCTPIVDQAHLQRLFNIIPGMQNFQYNKDQFNGYSKALVTYEDERSAAHAVDRLNNFEFPSGEIVTVKPDNRLSKAAEDLTSILSSFKSAVDNGSPDLLQLADAIAQASTLIKAATSGAVTSKLGSGAMADSNICSVSLPPVKPLAPPNSTMVKRCFIVCKPRPPPHHALQDLFCRFGDLIDIIGFPNKTFVFARYASESSAQDAINTLHGATIFGTIQLKVMEADEPKNKDKDLTTEIDDDDVERDGERKRMKL